MRIGLPVALLILAAMLSVMTAHAGCYLPGHSPASGGIPPVSFPCSPKEVAEMTSLALEAEQQACVDAAAAVGAESECGPTCDCVFLAHYEIPTLEDLERQLAELQRLAEQWRQGWPALRQAYLDRCDNSGETARMAEACGAQLRELITSELKGQMPDWFKVFDQAVNPTKRDDCFRNPIRYWVCGFVETMTPRVESGGCIVETIYSMTPWGEDQFCEDAAHKIHTDTRVRLEQRIAEVSALRDTWAQRIRDYVANHRCDCPTTSPAREGSPAETEAGS